MLYESFIHPLTILSTLPSAGLGALLTLWAFGQDLGVIAIILANIVLLSALLCFASPDLGWRDFVYNWYNNLLDLFVEPIRFRLNR